MRALEKKWLGLSLGLHILTGVFSRGSADMDEHFQILEFAAYLLGRRTQAGLPHEFFERCRSMFQPTFCEMLARIWLFLGVDSPEVWVATIRIATALIGWLSLVALYLWAKQWMKKPGYLLPLVLQLSALLYYIPYVHARHSSESLGGSFFFTGFALFFLFGLDRKDTSRALLKATGVGFMLGLAFLSRFQMGFAIAGFGAWCLWKRVRVRGVSGLALGFLLALGLGVLLDRRGYGQWLLTPAIYFKTSFLMGAANSDGVSPWWAYFRYMGYDVPYVGYIVGAAILLGWFAQPANPLTWATFLFFAIHSVVGHKEPRYMYPLVSALPILVTLGYSKIRETFFRGRAFGQSLWCRPVKWAVVALNMAGLIGVCLKPARAQVMLYDFVYAHRESIQEVHVVDGDPFVQIGLPMGFYLPLGFKTVPDTFPSLLGRASIPPDFWLSYSRDQLPVDSGALKDRCEMKYSVFPRWLKFFEYLPGIRNSASRTSLFYCR